MAKKGRKPKEKKGYFYEAEEAAIVQYINSKDMVERNRLFNSILYPALTKMIESIIRRYKLFIPDEDFEQNFSDTISYLLSKIDHYDPSKGCKAYSYCGTVCKNYLMYKSTQYAKKRQRNVSYDEIYEELSNDIRYVVEEDAYADIAEKLVVDIANEIDKMVQDPEENLLNENEVKVGKALVNLLRNWEEVLPNEGSNKLQKSWVLYFLREETMMTTKEVRDNMKKYKCVYKLLKKIALE